MQSGSYSNRINTTADRVAAWFSKHWLAVINTVLAVYVGLPFLPPILIETGHPLAANIIYAVYAPLCHQLPQRSFFLFGERPTYSIQELADRVGQDNLPWYPWPRTFTGDDHVGYKVALCERDIAIWGALLLSGLIFDRLRSRIKPIPFWVYILIGVLPMGLDGGSQLISYVIPALFGGLPRESTWVLRLITGGLFGWATAWLVFPYLQTSFAEIGEMSSTRLAKTTLPTSGPEQ